ncbi:MAG: hypothetical protein WC058_01100 [Phycisphaeraceae bacterium]
MAQSWLRYANQGATRRLPLNPQLEQALGSFLPELGVTMEVFSGGQPGKGEGPRVGSTRHDHGNAADVYFYKDGRRLDWGSDADRPVFEEVVRRGRAAGVTGFGAGPGYMGQGAMHLGFGNPGVWGAGGKGANAPDWLRAAYDGTPTRMANAHSDMPDGPKGQEEYRPVFGSMAPPSQPAPSPIPPEVARYATAEEKKGPGVLSKFLSSLETMPAAPVSHFPGGPSAEQANALANVLNKPTVADLLMSKRLRRRA